MLALRPVLHDPQPLEPRNWRGGPVTPNRSPPGLLCSITTAVVQMFPRSTRIPALAHSPSSHSPELPTLPVFLSLPPLSPSLRLPSAAFEQVHPSASEVYRLIADSLQGADAETRAHMAHALTPAMFQVGRFGQTGMNRARVPLSAAAYKPPDFEPQTTGVTLLSCRVALGQ